MVLGIFLGKEVFRKSCIFIFVRVDVQGLEFNIFLLVFFILKLLIDFEQSRYFIKINKRIGNFKLYKFDLEVIIEGIIVNLEIRGY